MTLEEINTRRSHLESEVLTLIKNFEGETGLSVSSIKKSSVEMCRSHGQPFMYLKKIEINIELPR